jgi:hypothetical protein
MTADIHDTQYGLGKIIREGWRVYSSRVADILPVVLIVYAPFLALLAVMPEEALTESLGRTGFLFLQQSLFVLFGFIALISNVGVAHIVEKTVLGGHVGWRDALRFGASRWGSAFVTNLLAGLILFGLTLLLIIPGIIWSVYYNFWIYAIANRGLSGKKALDYSKNLVRGQWWRVCGIQITLFVLMGAVTLAANQLLALIPAGQIVHVLNSLLAFLAASVLAVMLNVWFLNIDYLRNPVADPGGDPS